MCISNFKKYLFGLIVGSYLITAIGVPVYLHYCGGELEEISYLTKATSCCGEDESHILKNSVDFTFKIIHSTLASQTSSDLFYVSLPFSISSYEQKTFAFKQFIESPPPCLQTDLMLSATFLRI